MTHTPDRSGGVFEFEGFRFTAGDRLLFRDGAPVPLRPRAADLLLALLERHGEVLSKQEILDRVWPDTAVSESALTFQINQIREALEDGRNGVRFIETLPKRGYRFVAPLTAPAAPDAPAREAGPAPAEPAVAAPGPLPSSAAPRGRWTLVVWGAAIAGAVGVLGLFQARAARTTAQWAPPRVARYTALSQDRTRPGPTGPLLAAANRLYFDTIGRLAALEPRTGAVRPAPALAGYRVYDVDATGSSFLASRIGDPGGEHGLWIVSRDGAARRVAALRVTGAAAWSPDADRIAFAFERDLFIARSDGSAVRRVLAAIDEIRWLRWSPDGARLRFDVGIRAERASNSSIWEATVDGRQLRRLFPQLGRAVCCGTWTADGRHYIFQEGPLQTSNLWSADGRASAAVGPLTPAPLTAGPLMFASPIASPDPSRIFAIGRREDGELTRLDPGSGTFAVYMAGLSAIYLSFSRDREWMSYEAFPQGVLWHARSDGRDARALTPPTMTIDGSALSPDGRWVVFRGRATPEARMKNYLLSTAGGTPQPLVEADIEQGIASWAPDSARLVYGDVPETFGLPTGSEALHVYDRRTRQTTTLPGSRGLWTARWSPDGRSIAALTIRDQGLRVYDVASGAWRALPAARIGAPVWSRDGTALFFDAEGTRLLRRLRVADGRVETVADLTGFPFAAYWWVGLSLDDQPLLLRSPGGVRLYALDLAQP